MNEIPPMDLFSKRYPITSIHDEGGVRHTAFIFDEVADPAEFAEIISILDNAEVGDLFVFKLNTPGGRLDTTLSIRDAIFASQANTVAEISGDCASAGTMIALACDGLYISKFSEFMCHNFSGGVGGKGHEIKARTDFMLGNNAELMKEVYKKFLTKAEIKKLIEGKDFYMGQDEVLERWDKVIAHREKQAAKQLEDGLKEQDTAMITHLSEQGYKVTKD